MSNEYKMDYISTILQEAGIPIDMVGGVSIGAFMGALWCSEKNITSVTQKAREWSRVSYIFKFKISILY